MYKKGYSVLGVCRIVILPVFLPYSGHSKEV